METIDRIVYSVLRIYDAHLVADRIRKREKEENPRKKKDRKKKKVDPKCMCVDRAPHRGKMDIYK